MEIKIGICDDEKIIRDYLYKLVFYWSKNLDYKVNIEKFSSGESFLFTYAEEKDFDILLLDIEMDGMNGVELASKIRNKNKEIQIIFITGYMDYIEQGYDVDALNYLLKPIKEEKFFEVLDKAVSRLSTSDKSIVIDSDKGLVKLSSYSIYYIEVSRNYLTVYTDSESYSLKMTLKEIEKSLDDSFFKVNRSSLVNLTYVKRVTKMEVELKDKRCLSLSRGKYEEMNKKIIEYF